MATVEATVTEQADLRAKMDKDQSDILDKLRAHDRSLQALHDTQSDHTRRLTRIEGDVQVLKTDVTELKTALGDVRIGVHAILDLLDTHLARKPRWASLSGLFKRDRLGRDVR
ncbi:MAG TPA: hypothetical protein VGG75_08700 [Trebonia sp.]|jgi:chromosome segregation ATPase